jgi:endoglycosylceramidase
MDVGADVAADVAKDVAADVAADVAMDVAADVAADLPSPAADPQALTFLRVANGAVVDETGRQWLFRGVNAKYEHLFDVTFSDGRTRNEGLPDFAFWDAPETARLGYNLVRLAINWSGLEPIEGQFNASFLELLDQVVDAYAAAGVYVLIDFHQDSYSKEIGEDGAPYWAILPQPERLGGPLWPEGGLQCPCGDLTARRLSQVTMDAFASFFNNTDGLRDRFVPAWQTVAKRYAGRAAVAGFEAMNEPIAFHVGDGFKALDDFHVAMAAALRQVNARHAYFLEPENGIFAITCNALARPTPFPDGNVVFAPHGYFGNCINLPPNMNTFDEVYAGLKPVLDGLAETAASYGGAFVMAEYYLQMGGDGMFGFMDALLALADERNMGLAHWYWRGVSGNDNPECNGAGTVYCLRGDGTWDLMATGQEHLSRPYPVAVPGRLVANAYDRDTGVLTFRFQAAGGEAAPLVFLPAHRFPAGAAITVDGAPAAFTLAPGTLRAALSWNGQAGMHDVVVTPVAPHASR